MDFKGGISKLNQATDATILLHEMRLNSPEARRERAKSDNAFLRKLREIDAVVEEHLDEETGEILTDMEKSERGTSKQTSKETTATRKSGRKSPTAEQISHDLKNEVKEQIVRENRFSHLRERLRQYGENSDCVNDIDEVVFQGSDTPMDFQGDNYIHVQKSDQHGSSKPSSPFRQFGDSPLPAENDLSPRSQLLRSLLKDGPLLDHPEGGLQMSPPGSCRDDLNVYHVDDGKPALYSEAIGGKIDRKRTARKFKKLFQEKAAKITGNFGSSSSSAVQGGSSSNYAGFNSLKSGKKGRNLQWCTEDDDEDDDESGSQVKKKSKAHKSQNAGPRNPFSKQTIVESKHRCYQCYMHAHHPRFHKPCVHLKCSFIKGEFCVFKAFFR